MSGVYVVLGLAIFINILAYGLYYSDKKRAKLKQQRIPEKVLLLVAFCGGAAGSLIAMYTYRHKTRHWYFVILVPFFLLLHLYLLGRIFA